MALAAMLVTGGGEASKRQSGTMSLRQVLRTGLTASAVAHLSALALVLWFAEVHPFGSVTAEPIAVDVVTPEQVAEKPEEAAEKKPEPVPTPKIPPSNAFDSPAQSAASSPPASAASASPAPEAAASPPQKQAAAPATHPDRQQAKAQPQPQQQPQQQPQPASASQSSPSASQTPASASPAPPSTPPPPAYKPPEPDLSVKYHVMLGLPQNDIGPLPTASSGDKSGDGGDAASKTADIASSLVAEFRRHLRTCSKLPKTVAASDNVWVKMRVFMTPEGRLAAEPVLIEASASMKGPLLMQSAIAALQACQPYAMLPADRYGEWKVLDLNFTPRDFAG